MSVEAIHIPRTISDATDQVFTNLFKGFAVVLFSRPSVGKGSISDFLKKLGFGHISTSGALTRMAESKKDDPEMQEVLSHIHGGRHVPFKHVIAAVSDRIDACIEANIPPILDGIPRDEKQGRWIIEYFLKKEIPCLTLELVCSRKEANKRRLERILKAREEGNPPRHSDLDVALWGRRQDEYETNYPHVYPLLNSISCYLKIDTEKLKKEQTRVLALEQIMLFSSCVKFGISVPEIKKRFEKNHSLSLNSSKMLKS